jgi:[histone H4]-N-methyl-L-lysine20 N-methyltransferase
MVPITSTQYKKVTHSTLATVNRKLVGAVGISHKRHAETAEDNSRPTKKKKPSSPIIRTAPKVNMSETARQLLSGTSAPLDGRRSNRTPKPSLKLREGDPDTLPKTRVSPRRYPPSSSSLSAILDSPDSASALPVSPTTPTDTTCAMPTTPTDTTPVLPKNITPKSLAVAAQPRDSNGRFGKKASTNGRYMRKQFAVGKRFTLGHKMLPRPNAMKSIASRALSDDEHADDDDEKEVHEECVAEDRSPGSSEHIELGEEALEDVVLKRTSDCDLDSSPRKKIRITESDASDESPTYSPRFIMGKGPLLRPNPISFARRKWAMEEDDSTAMVKSRAASVECSTADVTPLAPAAVITSSRNSDSEVDDEDNQNASDGSPSSAPSTRFFAPMSRMARLTFGPSPMNLAKRRWASSTSEGLQTGQFSLLRETKTSSLCHSFNAGGELGERQESALNERISASQMANLAYPEYDDSDEEYTTEDVRISTVILIHFTDTQSCI